MSAPLSAARLHVRPRGADRDALRDVSIALREGEVLALVGPNGSGKSTLLASLARDLEPRSGELRLGDENAAGTPRRRFAQAVAWLPQQPEVAAGFTVEALVLQGRHAHRPFLAAPSAADRRAVDRALRTLDLLDLRRRAVETLSGGERRRVWLAMALCQEAPVLLLDEPTAALDLRHQWEVLALLARLNREHGLTLGVVLHDLEQAAALAHRVAVLHRGRLYASGAPETCLTHEALRDVWGVDAEITKEDGFVRVRVRGPADPIRSL
jgi:iron complex transport system ATP-binding protein